MAHGTKQRASVEPVLDVVLATDAVYLLKNGELLELRTTEVALFEFGYIIHFLVDELTSKQVTSERVNKLIS